jgi:tetratricopeptide (TPR) repeat protein
MRAVMLAALIAFAGFAARADAPAACDKAALLYRSGEFSESVDGYSVCLEAIDGDTAAIADAYHRRGRAHMKLGELDAAMTDYDLAIAVQPEHAGAWNSRAWVLFLQGSHEAALDTVDRALALDNARALDTRAHILAALQRDEDAMAAFDRAMALQTPEGVAKTQDHLRAAGYDPGPIDGIYGPLTRQALVACVADACNLWN